VARLRLAALLVLPLCVSSALAGSASLVVEVHPDKARLISGDSVTFTVAVKNANNGQPATLNGRTVTATFPEAATSVALTAGVNSTFTYTAATQGMGTQTLTATVRPILPPQAPPQILASGSASIFVFPQPTLSITSPTPNQFLRGTVSVAVDLHSVLPGRARLVVDGIAGAWSDVGMADFSLNLNTASMADGTHTIAVDFSPAEFPARVFSSPTVSVKVDNTAPEISSVSPLNGAFTKNPQQAITATYSDAGCGVAVAAVVLKVDGAPVAAFAGSTVVTFIPTVSWSEGSHAVELNLADVLGNSTSQAWSFYVDTVAPTGQITGPSITNNKRPTFTGLATDAAPSSGLNSASLILTLDGQDVTAQAQISGGTVTWTPPADLGEGQHTLTCSFADNAGNPGSVSKGFATDYTPSAAPVVQNTIRTVDRVTLSGATDADVVRVLASAQDAQVESAMIASFVVVFAKTASETFSYTLQLEDAAGNLSAITTGTDFFLPTGGGGGPPIQIGAFNLTVPEDFKKVVDGNRILTDSSTVLVDFVVTGGTPPFFASVNGISASGGEVGSIFEATLSGLPEGAQEISISASDSAGQTASVKQLLVVDLSPPVVSFDGPTVTALLGFLYLNDPAVTPVVDTANDASFPRVTFDKKIYSPTGIAQEVQTRITAIRAKVIEANETGLAGDLKWPFTDYGTGRANQLSTLYNNIAKAGPFELLEAGSTLVSPFNVGLVATSLPQASFGKMYGLVVESENELGTKGYGAIWFKIDTTAPTAILFDRFLGLGNAVTAGVHTTTAPIPPNPYPDLLHVRQGGVVLKRAWVDGPWVLESIPNPISSSGSPVTLELIDVAGNKKTVTANVPHKPEKYGLYMEHIYKEIEISTSDPTYTISIEYPVDDTFLVDITNQGITAATLRVEGQDCFALTP